MNSTGFSKFGYELSNVLSTSAQHMSERNMMSPFKITERLEKQASAKGHRTGAVAILFYETKGTLHIPLILRPDYNGVHSGQVSFPGGAVDKSDTHLVDTAWRETGEEIGVRRSVLTLSGTINPIYIPPSNFLVYPFVGLIKNNPEFVPDPVEVEEIIELPVNMLLDEKIVEYGLVKSAAKVSLKVPYFNVFGHKVWGATAIMLADLKAYLSQMKTIY